ncbi:hypothetical protein [Echinicola rosea]|nr:hypothetical protein [Echinicola rosea]
MRRFILLSFLISLAHFSWAQQEKTIPEDNNKIPRSNMICRVTVSLQPTDHFLADSIPKTDFYEKMVTEIDETLNINGKTNTVPLIIIDGVPSKIADLNKYTETEIGQYQILSHPSSTAIFGSRGDDGVVLIKTN